MFLSGLVPYEQEHKTNYYYSNINAKNITFILKWEKSPKNLRSSNGACIFICLKVAT